MFIGRNTDGTIYGAWTVRQFAGQEELPDSDPALVAFLAPKPTIDLSNVDNLERTLKALALVMRDYCNALKAGTYTARTVQDLRADFAAKYNALPVPQ